MCTMLPDEYYDNDIHIWFNIDGEYDESILIFRLIRKCWKEIHHGNTQNILN